jgi:hypothetical protein
MRKKTWYYQEKDTYIMTLGFNTTGANNLGVNAVGPYGISCNWSNSQITVVDAESGTISFAVDLGANGTIGGINPWTFPAGSNYNNTQRPGAGHYIIQGWGEWGTPGNNEAGNISSRKFGPPEDFYVQNVPWLTWSTGSGGDTTPPIGPPPHS